MVQISRKVLLTIGVNAITATRLCVGMASVWLFFSVQYSHLIVFAFIFIFFSDLADGLFARKYNVATRAGALFDYVVDRMVFFLLLGMLTKTGTPVYVIAPYFLRDMLYIFVQSYIRLDRVPGTKSVSFISTASVYIAVIYVSFYGPLTHNQNLILFILLCVTVINMGFRIYQHREQLLRALKSDVFQ